MGFLWLGNLITLASVMSSVRLGVWFGILALSAVQAFAQGPFIASCSEDAHIKTAKKKTIDSVAMDFVQKVLGPSPSTAFDSMSKAGQADTARQHSTPNRV